MEVETKAIRNGFDVASLIPIAIERSSVSARGTLALTLSGKVANLAQLSRAARRKFAAEATVEYLGSDRMPDVLAIRSTPKGTKYGVPLAKTARLPGQISRLLRDRGWEPGRHPAEWRDGALVIWRSQSKPEGSG